MFQSYDLCFSYDNFGHNLLGRGGHILTNLFVRFYLILYSFRSNKESFFIRSGLLFLQALAISTIRVSTYETRRRVYCFTEARISTQIRRNRKSTSNLGHFEKCWHGTELHYNNIVTWKSEVGVFLFLGCPKSSISTRRTDEASIVSKKSTWVWSRAIQDRAFGKAAFRSWCFT